MKFRKTLVDKMKYIQFTYNLKVYNRSDDDINIPSVKLALGEDSEYRLNVDGIAGKSFENIEILAKDSMFIFIETTVNYDDYANSETTFLYTDHIEFGTNIQLDFYWIVLSLFTKLKYLCLNQQHATDKEIPNSYFIYFRLIAVYYLSKQVYHYSLFLG